MSPSLKLTVTLQYLQETPAGGLDHLEYSKPSAIVDRTNGASLTNNSTKKPVDASAPQPRGDKAISDKALSDKAISDKAISDKAIKEAMNALKDSGASGRGRVEGVAGEPFVRSYRGRPGSTGLRQDRLAPYNK